MELTEKVAKALEVLRKINKYTGVKIEFPGYELDYWKGINNIYNEFLEIDCPDLDIAYPSLNVLINDIRRIEIFKDAFRKEAETYLNWYMQHKEEIKPCHDFNYKIKILTERADDIYGKNLEVMSEKIRKMNEREHFYNDFMHEWHYYKRIKKLDINPKPRKEKYLEDHPFIAMLFRLKYERTKKEQAEIERYEKFYEDYLTFLTYFNPPHEELEELTLGWNYYETFGKEKEDKKDEHWALCGERWEFIYGQAPLLDTKVYDKIAIWAENAMIASTHTDTDILPAEEPTKTPVKDEIEKEERRGAPRKHAYKYFKECFEDTEKYSEIYLMLKKEQKKILKAQEDITSGTKKLDAHDCKGLCLTLIGKKYVTIQNVEKLANLMITEFPDLFSVTSGGSVKNSQSPNMKHWECLY